MKPDVRFLDPIPFTPHVIHPSCPINEAELSQELLGYLERIRRQEAGWCCYVRANAWLPTVEYDLALCLYLVSGILSGARVWGERGSLNPLALQWFQRERMQLPLGDPLPFPHSDATGAALQPTTDEDEDPIAWEESESETA